jgi:DNA-binding transcriptional regulator YhcF (GntR family)
VKAHFKTRKGPSSIKLYRRVLKDMNLPLAVIGFLAKLKLYAGPLGVIPSGDTMADDLGINRKTTWKYIAVLEREGLIDRVHRLDPETKKRTSNAYILKDEKKAELLSQNAMIHVPKNGTKPIMSQKTGQYISE